MIELNLRQSIKEFYIVSKNKRNSYSNSALKARAEKRKEFSLENRSRYFIFKDFLISNLPRVIVFQKNIPNFKSRSKFEIWTEFFEE